jgi:hypothetical protein
MKKVLFSVLGALTVAAFAAGCSTTHVSKYSAPLTVKVETQATPTVKVGGLIDGQAKIQRVLFFKWGVSKFAECINYGGAPVMGLFGDSFAMGKAAAAYDACEKNKCDVIIAPSYVIEDNNYFVYQKTLFTVKGYKGNLQGIK